VVEGDEVEMGRFELAEDIVDFADVECFDVEDGDSVDVEASAGVDDALGCCVWMRVFTTSRGVVMTPANPPALAAVRISNGSPMLFEPMYCFARSLSSS
jgi:hypothetical protein